MTQLLAIIPAWEAAFLLVLAMIVGWEVGRRLGARNRHEGVAVDAAKFGDAIRALLGLLLAFTFSLALTKHEQRRVLAIAEANAIGDFYTTTSLLKDPVRSNLQATTREYLESRLELAKGPITFPALALDLKRVDAFHARMTELVGQAIDERTPTAVPLINDLNRVTSTHAARLAAFRDRLPGSIVLLLFFASIISMALSGRDQAVGGNIQIVATIFFLLLVSATVFVTLDLNQPRRGLITVSQEPLEDLLATMNPH